MGWSSHRELILHWFRARGQLSAGAVEGLDGKVRVITKPRCLPEPDFTHRFC
jgi:hypothetical protein